MLIDKNSIIQVTNRSRGSVGYKIPDLDIHRQFFPGETKELTMNELRHLKVIPGGFRLMDKYLIIHNIDAVNELMGNVEPEYYYTREDVVKLLSEGTLEQLEDCLDFASDGVIDLVKDVAVDIEVNNVAMRRVILEKTHFNVDNAIMVKHETEESDSDAQNAKTRRSAPINATSENESPAPVRRTSPPKYNVIKK